MVAPLSIDRRAHGTRVTLARGQALHVALPENPTTGYRWSVRSAGGLQLVASTFVPAGAAVGGGGTRRFEWLEPAGAPGVHRVSLALRREWETTSAPADVFDVTVAGA